MDTEKTASPITLRNATSEDVAFLCVVYSSTRTEELALTDWSDEQKAVFCQMQFEAQDAHYRAYYPGAVFSVIERNGEAIGRLYVDRWTNEIRIMDITLLPIYRGRGAGGFLLGLLQDEARHAGKILSIHVEKMNPALRLYERLGFVPVEDKGIHLLMNWSFS